jgi:hypothetical protein
MRFPGQQDPQEMAPDQVGDDAVQRRLYASLRKFVQVFSRGSVRQRCASDVWYSWRMEESCSETAAGAATELLR